MLSSDQDSAEDAAASGLNDVDGEEEEEDSPAESDVPEEVRADRCSHYFFFSDNFQKSK